MARRIILVALILLLSVNVPLLGTSCSKEPEMTLSDIYEKVKPAVVAFAIVNEQDTNVNFQIFGSGFCVDPSGIIVTARHVITDYYEYWLKSPLPQYHTELMQPIQQPDFRVVFFRKVSNKYEALWVPVVNFIFPFLGDHPEDDVAVVRIPKSPSYWGSEYTYLTLGDINGLREGDEVAVSGYPLKWPLVSQLADLSEGIISRIDARIGDNGTWEVTKLQLDITVNAGNSGGPAFVTKSGKVIGLVSQERLIPLPVVPDELKSLMAIPAGLSYYIPSETISKAISALKSAELNKGNTEKP